MEQGFGQPSGKRDPGQRGHPEKKSTNKTPKLFKSIVGGRVWNVMGAHGISTCVHLRQLSEGLLERRCGHSYLEVFCAIAQLNHSYTTSNIDLDSLHHDPYKSRTKHNINIMIAASCFQFRANLHMATTRFGKRATPKP